jgi:hypothetical protein
MACREVITMPEWSTIKEFINSNCLEMINLNTTERQISYISGKKAVINDIENMAFREFEEEKNE